MDLMRIAARVAVGPDAPEGEPAVMASWFEGGSYSPEDIVGGLPSHQGPVWAALYGFGWVITTQEPATLPPETPADGAGIADTWGEMQEHEDFGPGVAALRPYPSVAAFAADDDTVRFMCSYDDAEREGIAAALAEAGFDEAAAKAMTVDF